jgi:2-polyprenyl-3-methyl-5-hydroxy-6-metoxy-1,4-benzoquinol methylase
MWDYLSSAEEAARYVVIASLLDRFCPGGPVLDVGCGEGLLHRYLDTQRYPYTGIDVSRVAIQRAIEKYPASTWLVADAAHVPRGIAVGFHAIVFNEVLYYLPDVAGTLTEYSRLLSGPSLVVVSVFVPPVHQMEWKSCMDGVWKAVLSFRWTALDDCLLQNTVTGIRWRIAAFRGGPAH